MEIITLQYRVTEDTQVNMPGDGAAGIEAMSLGKW